MEKNNSKLKSQFRAHLAEISLSKIFLKHQIICWSIATGKETFNKETTTEFRLCMTEFKLPSCITVP